MALLVLSLVVLLTIVIGAALARAVLSLVLHLLVEGDLRVSEAVRTAASGLVALVR